MFQSSKQDAPGNVGTPREASAGVGKRRETSEERHGLPPQPGPLCYHIDFGVHPALIAGDVQAAEAALNMLRREIMDLRAWGEAWKQHALNGDD